MNLLGSPTKLDPKVKTISCQCHVRIDFNRSNLGIPRTFFVTARFCPAIERRRLALARDDAGDAPRA